MLLNTATSLLRSGWLTDVLWHASSAKQLCDKDQLSYQGWAHQPNCVWTTWVMWMLTQQNRKGCFLKGFYCWRLNAAVTSMTVLPASPCMSGSLGTIRISQGKVFMQFWSHWGWWAYSMCIWLYSRKYFHCCCCHVVALDQLLLITVGDFNLLESFAVHICCS